MRDIYLDKIVDLTDPDCAFVKEFDHEVSKYGAVVYNHEYNSYQLVKSFHQIDYKKELLPDFVKVANSDPRLKGLQLTIHYEFDPETEQDEDNLAAWKQMSATTLPVFGYDDEGELVEAKTIPLYPTPSVHTVWFLDRASYDYVLDLDLLMIDPIIKNLAIAQKLIRDYGLHPFSALYDEDDLASYHQPVLYGVTGGHHHDSHADHDGHDEDDEDADAGKDE